MSPLFAQPAGGGETVLIVRLVDAERVQPATEYELQGNREGRLKTFGWRVLERLKVRDARFQAVVEPGEPGRTQLLMMQVGAEPVDDINQYPNTLVMFQGGRHCMATLVGPKALLTAAHCVGQGPYKLYVGKYEPVGLQCAVPKDYKPAAECELSQCPPPPAADIAADIALCISGDSVLALAEPAESIDAASRLPGTLEAVGFLGCGAAPHTNVLLSAKLKFDPPDAASPTEIKRHFLTSTAPPESPMCPNDSGTAWYATDDNGRRTVKSVHAGEFGNGGARGVRLDLTGLKKLATQLVSPTAPVCGVSLPAAQGSCR